MEVVTEERWILLSEEAFNRMRPDVGADVIALHTTPDAMEYDEDIHSHLDEGGIVVIHCEAGG